MGRPNLLAARFERSKPVRIGGVEAHDARQRGAAFAQTFARGARIGEDQPRAGMFENVAQMVQRLRRVDRDDDAARKKRAEIGDDPVHAVMRDQRDSIARAQAGIPNRARDALHAVDELRSGRGRPRRVHALEQHLGARLGERVPNESRKRHLFG